MDNKTYLDQIAVKGDSYQKNSLLSPGVIKLIIGAVIALIAILIVAAVLSANNNKPKTLARSLFVRTSLLSSETGPLNTYGRKIKNSELRSYNSQIKSALNQATITLGPILENMKVSTEIDEEGATDEDSKAIQAYAAELNESKLKGLLDRQYPQKTNLQLTYVLNLCYELQSLTHNETLHSALTDITKDLSALQKNLNGFEARQ